MAVLNLKEAAAYLRVHPVTMYKVIKENGLGRKVGQRWRFLTDELDRYLSCGVGFESANRGANNEAGNS